MLEKAKSLLQQGRLTQSEYGEIYDILFQFYQVPFMVTLSKNVADFFIDNGYHVANDTIGWLIMEQ